MVLQASNIYTAILYGALLCVQLLFSCNDIVSYNDLRDWKAIAAIFRENPEFLDVGDDDEFGLQDIHSKLIEKQYASRVIRTNEQTVGFVMYWFLELSGLRLPFKPVGMPGIVLFLGVAKKYQRKGYGEALLLDAIAQLKKQPISYITLTTQKKNLRARALYEKIGFHNIEHESDSLVSYTFMCTRQ